VTPRRGVVWAAVALLATAAQAPAQQTHLLIVTGLSGEPQYRTAFHRAASELYDAATTRWGVAAPSLVYLAENPAIDATRITGRSTREEVERAFLALAQRAAPGDVVLVFLLGHGSGQGPESAVNLPGPDPTAGNYASWISGFARQTVVFVNASSASGDFVRVLSGPGRIVVTATRTAMERNESVFARYFVQGITSGEADADKDDRISVFEAFDFARREVARAYETDKKLLTEHAVISDTTLASTVTFGGAPASTDPRVVALVAERRTLEDSLTALRARKDSMDPGAYERELEQLLVAIAEKSQAIRALGGRE
jgi:hypothetical protein